MSALRDAMSHAVLGWVKPELDETLRLARSEVEYFGEEPEDTSRMQFCAGYLHQVQGTLRMVELYAPAMVAEELELLAHALQENATPDRDEALATLMRGTVLLPDYLERLQSGHRDIPIVLLPLLNDVRAARGAPGLSESVLFAPDLERPLPKAVPLPEVLSWQARQTRMDAGLQALDDALANWPEASEPVDGVALDRALKDLLEAVEHIATRRMLWVAASVADALSAGALEYSAAARQAFAGVSRAVRASQQDGGVGLAAPSQEPTRQLLYLVSKSSERHPALDELRTAFGLDAEAFSQAELDHARGSVTGRNRALLDTVGVAVKEELLRIKDALDLHLRTGAEVSALQTQVTELGNVADTLGMVGLGMARDVIQRQRDSLREMVAGTRETDEAALLDIAGALLYVDASLDDQVSRLGQSGAANAPEHASSESQRTLEVLAQEAISNFSSAREGFVAFIETNWSHSELTQVPRLLGEVAGALRMLELPQPAQYLLGVSLYVSVELIEKRRIPGGQQLDTLADAMASLEYYLEALRENRPNRDEILDITRSSLEKLRYWPLPAAVDDRALTDVSTGLALPESGAPEEQAAAPAAVEPEAVDAAPAGSDSSGDATGELEILPFDTATYTETVELDAVASDSSEEDHAHPAQDAADTGEPAFDEEPLREATSEDAALPSPPVQAIDEDGADDAGAAEVVSAEMEKLRGSPEAEAESEDEPAIEQATLEAASVPLFDYGDAGSFQLADNDIDDDIREVFLEEFDEEIVNLEQMLPQWSAAPGNMERLRSIRRVFHTLKGSGRLVGAKLLGEFSWKTENMLNRVLDGSRPPSPAVMALLQRVADVLPQLNAALKGQGSISADLQGLQDLADRIGAGEEAFYVAPPATGHHAEPAFAEPAAEVETPAVYRYDEDGTPAKVDGVLREILEVEVAAHLETVERWLQQARPEPIASSEALLRAFHTMNGAFAMADVPEITEVTGAAEQYIKRLWAASLTPSEEGVMAIADAAHAVRHSIAALAAPAPRIPVFAALASQLTSLRDTLPESRLAPVLVDDSSQNTYAGAGMLSAPIGPMDVELTVHDLSRYIDAESPALEGYDDSALGDQPAPEIPFEAGAPSDDAAAAEDAYSGAPEPVTFFEVDLTYTTAAARRMAEEAARAAALEEAGASVEQAHSDQVQGPDAGTPVGSADEPVASDLSSFDAGGEQAEDEAAVDDAASARDALEGDDTPVETFADPGQERVPEAMDEHAPDAEHLWQEAAGATAAASASSDGSQIDSEAGHAEAEGEAAQEDAESVDELSPAEAAHADLEQDGQAVEAAATAIDAGAEEAEQAEADEAEEAEEAEKAEEAQAHVGAEVEAEPALDTEAEAEAAEVDEVATGVAAETESESALADADADAEAPAPAAAFEEPVEEPMVDAMDAASDRSEQLDDAVNAAAPATAEQEMEAPMTSSEDVLDDLLDFTELDRDLVDIFVEEGNDLLDHSDGLLAKLRDTPDDRSLVTGLQRDLHTIKGGSRMAGINAIGDLGHAIESLLEQVAAQRIDLDRESVQLLERGFDGLHGMVALVGAHRQVQMPTDLIQEFERRAHPERATAAADSGDAPATRAPVAPLAPLSAPVDVGALADDDIQPYLAQEQVRVRADLLDRLVNNAGEVAIYRSRLEQQLGAFRGAMSELDRTNTRLHDQLRRLDLETEAQIVARYQREQDKRDPTFDPLELDRFSTLQQLSRGLAESAADLTGLQGVLDDLARQYDGLLQQQSRVSSELQDGLMRARMVPFDGIVPRLRRVLRQAATDTGKQVKLQLEGAHGELDRNVLERMTAPLEHLLRNAVAHGLESPKVRRKAGKAEEGTVQIALRREGAEMVLEVSDDGAGIDHAAIRRRAEQRKMVQPGANVSNTDLERMILESGFSTSDNISQLAGRGVGMDVVYSEVRQLGGSLEIQSQSKRGTSFTLRLPQTLAVTQAVFVEIGDTQFAVPVAAVAGVGRIARERFETEGAVYVYAGEDYVLHDLGTLTGHAPARAEGMPQVPLLLVRAGDLRAAVAVDQVLGNREIVVKPVGPQIASVPGIYGATITGDGRIVVILDVAPLVRRHILQPQLFETDAPAPEERRVPLVMVVDDSLTMRKVTGRVLERHNFEVSVARDGVEALERLEERVPDLMLLDIEMPRMDGYELATAMKADPRFKDVPIVMITSRTGDKHRQRAIEIGVQRYMGKPYQELDLMRNVYDLLGIARVRE